MKTVRLVCLGIALGAAAVLAQDRAPKLLVLLVVDQMRADYVDKFQHDQWQSSPYADEYLAMMSLDIAERLHLENGSSNLLAISFSALDKVGHDFGPNSHEVQDVLVRLDRTLAGVFDRLDRLVGAGRYTVALTADHGVAPLPERMTAEGFDAGRVTDRAVVDAIDRGLQPTLGTTGAVARFMNSQVYLKPGVFERMMAAPSAVDSVRTALRAVPGVMDIYTRDRVAANQFEGDAIGRRLARSYYAGRSGDLMIVLRPYWLFESTGASHGTPFEYDVHVPLFLMGKGIVPGEYLGVASPADIVPSLAFLAGITLPRPQGRVLSEAMKFAGNLRH